MHSFVSSKIHITGIYRELADSKPCKSTHKRRIWSNLNPALFKALKLESVTGKDQENTSGNKRWLLKIQGFLLVLGI
jgi:competence protein ComGF